MPKSKAPPPSATHQDDPLGGVEQIAILEARMKTLEEHGEEAMSEHDLRFGYTPQSIIRLLKRQIVFLRRDDEIKASLARHREDEKRLNAKRLAKVKHQKQINEDEKKMSEGSKGKKGVETLVDMKREGKAIDEARAASHESLTVPQDEKMKETRERISKLKKGGSGFVELPADVGEGSDGAAKLFEQTSDIRRAIGTLRSEQRETRKRYKVAITTLEDALEGIYDSFDDKQMRLFDEEPALGEEVQSLVDHPSLM